MRYIKKNEEPVSLRSWKALENEDWKPSYKLLQNPQKADLHHALLEEQGYLCCYCGREITIETSHIEHFRPQHSFQSFELDYLNLHASCIRECNPELPLHCGHHKGDWFDGSLAISPLEPSCEQRFAYTLMGEISPTDCADLSACTIIEKLKLNIAYLNNRREEILKGVFDDEFLVNSSNEELKKVATIFRAMVDGRYESLGHVVARYAEQLTGGI